MRRGRLSAVVLLAAVGGCSSVSEPPTLGSLSAPTATSELPPAPEISLDAAAQGYRSLLDDAPPGDLYQQALRRLADLELELGEVLSIHGEDFAAMDRRLGVAVQLYTAYLNNFPDDPRNDRVLYQLAKAHELHGDSDAGLATLERLLREHRDTDYYIEAQFRRGEMLFMRRAYQDAEQAYAAALEHDPDSLFFEKALYKYGWSLFKQNRFDAALTAFFRLLDLRAEQVSLEHAGPVDGLARAERELLEDSLRVISLSFVYQQDAEAPARHFARLGVRRYEPLIYRRLGELYRDRERYRDAADTYFSFITSRPDHALAPQFHEYAIEAYQAGRFPSLVLGAKESFAQRYGVDGAYWATHDEAVRSRIRPLLAVHLRDLAMHYHAAARQTRKAEQYQVAARWYGAYLNAFPDGPDAGEMNFLLAESLQEAGHYAEAIAQYEKTAYDYPTHARSAEAGYAALLAYPALATVLPAPERPLWKQLSLASALRFSERFPDDARVDAVLAKTAEEFLALNDHVRAAYTAERLLSRPRGADVALHRTGWAVLGHAHFEQGHYADAEHAYVQVLRLRPSPQFAQAINERLAASIYKQAEAARAEGALRLAAYQFLRLGRTVAGSPLRAVADYDAAAVLLELEDWQGAGQVLEDLRRRGGDPRFDEGVSEKLSLVYIKTGQGARAARELEALATPKQAPDYRRELLWQAATLYHEDGRAADAARVLRRYVQEFPAPLTPALEARQRLSAFHAQRGEADKQHNWLRALIAAEKAGGAERSAQSRALAAQASMVLAAPVRESYQKVNLTLPLERSLKQKRTLMERAIQQYTEALDYQVAAVSTEAIYSLGLLYQDFGRAIMGSQRPTELTEDELEQYEILLEEQAFPFEEKAIDIHLTNLQHIPEGIYDRWVKSSLEALAVLQPFRYSKAERSEEFVHVIH